ncbi:tRNA pseudouridine(38-40) synthase [Rubrobacter radiotolerans]|uniref:tRNA pseudouridine synthase A n=1 Tax=Rubrobacter radiotolerans TaxID=42256 RepID=A0A023X4C6_RUBRA|nr:tRNA pseudouridine(38-40) synthase TruA [Rubrobacter radiotolerans]AHY47193.1 tRNA pseudouridine(38-40) synthase [Rubrobacter radiotolerans]MDX5894596.1 tRNA pseudouridine(38-40) synthase TruA [Rubrobacter radiotolerans]SMC06342.1 tRNA pseudouridine38-40 synthase [Rubrobacter radiotolerans DSM 5868]
MSRTRRKLAALVEYDGTDFDGWARQPGRRTVEGELARALGTILRHPVKLTVAGRTDAGVHASGQVASFFSEAAMEPDEVAYRATAVLPKDVAVRRCVSAPDSFDARRDARSRSYRYRLVNAPTRSALDRRYAAYVARPLDLGLLRGAADLVLGLHDFTAFTPTKSYHTRFTREVSLSCWEREGEVLVYSVTADSFMYGMVRALVGTMIEVGDGSRSLASFAELLGGGRRSGSGPSAPARGLTLVGVEYANLTL